MLTVEAPPAAAEPDELDVEAAVQTLTDVVEEFGKDHVYKRPHPTGYCMYVHDGKPSCIVAQVLSRHGWSVGRLAGYERRSPGAMIGEGTLTVRASIALANAQQLQDEGKTWGLALAVAANSAAAFITPATRERALAVAGDWAAVAGSEADEYDF